MSAIFALLVERGMTASRAIGYSQALEHLDEVTADGAVPLARLIPAGMDVNGAPTRAQIILFRRPLESRAKKGTELLDLIHEVLVQQVATHLGVDEDTIDRGPE